MDHTASKYFIKLLNIIKKIFLFGELSKFLLSVALINNKLL